MRIQNQRVYQQQQQAFAGAKGFYYSFITSAILTYVYTEISQYHRLSLISFVWIIINYACSIYQYRKSHSIKSFASLAEQPSYSESTEMLRPQYPQKYFCKICLFQRNYRTKHCHKCGVCINKFDHHCFWIGNCVGQFNHKYFYYFLFYQTNINAFFSFVFYDYLNILNSQLYYIYFAGFLLALGFSLFTGYLLIYHTMLIVTNQTTWEQMSRSKITYLKYLPKGYNPFSLGFLQNINRFFFQRQEEPQNWTVPSFQQAKTIKPSFNICDNQYYSCC